jgi:transposase
MSPPIQMCDALASNIPQELVTLLANCMTHARRQFVDVVEVFPEQSIYVIEQFAQVYRHDSIAKEQDMSPRQRLLFHQKESKPIMDNLKKWFEQQFDDKNIEPNSSFGKAINYMTRHWQELTLFLRVEGAPLDNNILERSLKIAIMNRKNAYFYKTLNGAKTGDIFMSIIQTCRLENVNALDYLIQLQKHTKQVNDHPHKWMPWNYQITMTQENLT